MKYLQMWKDMPAKQKRQSVIGVIAGVGLLFVLSLPGKEKEAGDAAPQQSSFEDAASVQGAAVGALVPLDTSSPIIVHANMSYALSLVYTYTPESAQQRFADFLRHYVDPGQRENVRLVMDRRLGRVLDSRDAQIMEENGLHFLPSGYQAALQSRLIKYDFDTNTVISSLMFHLLVEYRYFDGHLYILSMNTIDAGEYTRIADSLKY